MFCFIKSNFKINQSFHQIWIFWEKSHEDIKKRIFRKNSLLYETIARRKKVSLLNLLYQMDSTE